MVRARDRPRARRSALTTASLRISPTQITIRFRFLLRGKSADVTFLVAYTYGKSIDNSSGIRRMGELLRITGLAGRSRPSMSVTIFVASYIVGHPVRSALLRMPRSDSPGLEPDGNQRDSLPPDFPVRIRQGEDQSLVGSSNTDVPDIAGPVIIQDPRNAGSRWPREQYFSPDSFTSPARWDLRKFESAFLPWSGHHQFGFRASQGHEYN